MWLFRPFAHKPPWMDLHQIWNWSRDKCRWGRGQRHSHHMFKFLVDWLKDVNSMGGGVKNQ